VTLFAKYCALNAAGVGATLCIEGVAVVVVDVEVTGGHAAEADDEDPRTSAPLATRRHTRIVARPWTDFRKIVPITRRMNPATRTGTRSNPVEAKQLDELMTLFQ
jgi:hypothetical protein